MAPSFSGVWKLQTKYQYNSAFPIDLKECSELETVPLVARQSDKTLLTSPLLNLKVTYLPSIARI